MSLSDNVQLNEAEKACKPTQSCGTEEDDNAEQAETQVLFQRLCRILDKLNAQNFQRQMKQLTELTIDTEERLKGVIDLIYEKAISEPSLAYPNMCRCLMGLKVPSSDKPGCCVNFRKLLLNRCQREFEKDLDDDEICKEKQKQMEAAEEGEERERLRVELQESREQAHRRSLGNIKFISELFKLKMLTEVIMHDCIVKLLKKDDDDESLECLCMLLSTAGKDLDFEKAKPRMDQYYNKIEKIVKEGKTSSRICSMLQDLLDVRRRGYRKEPSSSGMFLSYGVQPKKAERARKSWTKNYTQSRGEKEAEDEDAEQAKTLELFERLRSILSKLNRQNFRELMNKVTEMKIDTEERLKGAIDLIFEKAISEANLAHPHMCRCLMGLKVPSSDNPGCYVNFRQLLLNRCQTEFEKDLDDDEIFKEKQKQMEAAEEGEERERLRVELQESRDQAHRRSLGNIKFISELFKVKMLTDAILHNCIVKLLKNSDDESLECLCMLLSTAGKDLDHDRAKPRMDQYYNNIEKIIKEGKTSSRICSMLQDLLDVRKVDLVTAGGYLFAGWVRANRNQEESIIKSYTHRADVIRSGSVF